MIIDYTLKETRNSFNISAMAARSRNHLPNVCRHIINTSIIGVLTVYDRVKYINLCFLFKDSSYWRLTEMLYGYETSPTDNQERSCMLNLLRITSTQSWTVLL